MSRESKINIGKHIKSTIANRPNKPNNKPGVIIHGNEKRMCVSIDVAISRDTEMKLLNRILKRT
jgi:hypothetical protein